MCVQSSNMTTTPHSIYSDTMSTVLSVSSCLTITMYTLYCEKREGNDKIRNTIMYVIQYFEELFLTTEHKNHRTTSSVGSVAQLTSNCFYQQSIYHNQTTIHDDLNWATVFRGS